MEWTWSSERALLLRFEGALDEANARAIATWRALQMRALDEIEDVVPGARTVLVTLRPGAEPSAALVDALAETHVPDAASEPAHMDIAARYDGEDLEDVARICGATPAEVAALHAGARYRVAFVGFSPGFAYLLGTPVELRVPRMDTPRARVPAGSIAIADAFSAVYPRATPGGWRLIGTAPGAALFDPASRPPAVLRPGDTVAFVAPGAESGSARTAVQAGAAAPGRARVVVVESAGALTTWQDAGRSGHGSSGVPPSGAFDASARALANAIAGAGAEAPVLECTLAGPTLRFDCDATVAVAGAGGGATLDGAPVPLLETIAVKAGQRLAVGVVRDGARAYVAFGGGADVTPVLDSASRHVGAELGPEPLRAGETFMLGDPVVTPVRRAARLPRSATVRVVQGAQWELFGDDARAALTSSEFRVSTTSDRTGVRLDGVSLRARSREIDPEGVPLGAIQVTPDGRAVVCGPDRPITGGYPKIATVVEADVPSIAQARPGDALRFEVVTIEEARAAWREHESALREGIVTA